MINAHLYALPQCKIAQHGAHMFFCIAGSHSEQIIVESTPTKPRQSLRVRRSSTNPTSAPKTPPKGPSNLTSRPQTLQSTTLTRSRRAFQQEEPVTPIESASLHPLLSLNYSHFLHRPDCPASPSFCPFFFIFHHVPRGTHEHYLRS